MTTYVFQQTENNDSIIMVKYSLKCLGEGGGKSSSKNKQIKNIIMVSRENKLLKVDKHMWFVMR